MPKPRGRRLIRKNRQAAKPNRFDVPQQFLTADDVAEFIGDARYENHSTFRRLVDEALSRSGDILNTKVHTEDKQQYTIPLDAAIEPSGPLPTHPAPAEVEVPKINHPLNH